MVPPPDSTAFVLIPGGFFPGSAYDKVTDRLRKKGYDVAQLDNPSTLPVPDGQKPADVYDDAANARRAAETYMDHGKNVIMVGNSYGGFVATEAVKALSESERQAAGKTGGRLANLVLIGSLIGAKGVSVTQLISGHVEVNQASDLPFVDAPPVEGIGNRTMSEAPPEEADEYAKRCRAQSTISFHQPLTHEGHLHVPTTSVITGKDQTLSPTTQHEYTDKLMSGGHKHVRKVTIPTDHVAMVSSPDIVVEVLLEAAEA